MGKDTKIERGVRGERERERKYVRRLNRFHDIKSLLLFFFLAVIKLLLL